jgi:hypothetical protein
MISYFKYTDGTGFTLDGANYSGMVTVVNDAAYAGSVYTSRSKVLSSKETFIANAILNQIEFDYNFSSNLKSKITSIEVYPKSILDITSIANIIDTLTENNLKIFASGVGYDQNYGNPLFNDSNTNTFVYGISSNGGPIISRKNIQTTLDLKQAGYIQTDKPVTDSSSIFTTLSSSFKYFNKDVTVQGAINSPTAPTISQSLLEGLGGNRSNIFYDKYREVIYQTAPSTVNIYTYDYDSPNNTILIKDELELSKLGVVEDLSKASYGKNYRAVVAKNQGQLALELYAVNSSEIIKSLTFEDVGIDNIKHLIQRFEDDALVLVGDIKGKLSMSIYDISKLATNTAPIYSQEIDTQNNPTVVRFSPFDSNIILFYYYTNTELDFIEFRPISVSGTVSPVTKMTSDQFTLPVESSAFSELTDVISTSTPTLYDGTSFTYDVQFDVSDKVYSLALANNYIKTNNNTIFNTIVPLDTAVRYNSIEVSDSSIGLVLNSAFKSIIYDTLILYYTFNTVKRIDSESIYQQTSSNIKNIDTSNLLLYSNESINVGALNRTIEEILTLQLDLAGKIDSAR